jgi:DNA-directed RNA polymerase subunit RPC12/RpoP
MSRKPSTEWPKIIKCAKCGREFKAWYQTRKYCSRHCSSSVNAKIHSAEFKAYKNMLKKVLQVMEGFDYRANINFTMSDCLDVEVQAKALLREVE